MSCTDFKFWAHSSAFQMIILHCVLMWIAVRYRMKQGCLFKVIHFFMQVLVSFVMFSPVMWSFHSLSSFSPHPPVVAVMVGLSLPVSSSLSLWCLCAYSVCVCALVPAFSLVVCRRVLPVSCPLSVVGVFCRLVCSLRSLFSPVCVPPGTFLFCACRSPVFRLLDFPCLAVSDAGYAHNVAICYFPCEVEVAFQNFSSITSANASLKAA